MMLIRAANEGLYSMLAIWMEYLSSTAYIAPMMVVWLILALSIFGNNNLTNFLLFHVVIGNLV